MHEDVLVSRACVVRLRFLRNLLAFIFVLVCFLSRSFNLTICLLIIGNFANRTVPISVISFTATRLDNEGVDRKATLQSFRGRMVSFKRRDFFSELEQYVLKVWLSLL